MTGRLSKSGRRSIAAIGSRAFQTVFRRVTGHLDELMLAGGALLKTGGVASL